MNIKTKESQLRLPEIFLTKKVIAYVKTKFPKLFYLVAKSNILVSFVCYLGITRYWFCKLRNKPYFGMYMMSAQLVSARIPFMKRLIRSAILANGSGPFSVLEIGSWAGGSTSLWASVITEQQNQGVVVCIDPWAPFIDETKQAELKKADKWGGLEALSLIVNASAKNNKIFNLFLHNIRVAGHSNIVLPLTGKSSQVLGLLKENHYDLVFLDAAKNYSNVIYDLTQASTLLKEGGLLCGDDLELQKDEIDVVFAEANREHDIILDQTSSKEFHPGVTLAVAKFFDRERITSFNGFWVMRKVRNEWESVSIEEN